MSSIYFLTVLGHPKNIFRLPLKCAMIEMEKIEGMVL